MTQLGKDIIDALSDTVSMTLVPASCRPTLTITHADGSIETRELGDVALVPVIDMPATIDDVTEIHDGDDHA